jgi:hypothetical protein
MLARRLLVLPDWPPGQHRLRLEARGNASRCNFGRSERRLELLFNETRDGGGKACDGQGRGKGSEASPLYLCRRGDYMPHLVLLLVSGVGYSRTALDIKI